MDLEQRYNHRSLKEGILMANDLIEGCATLSWCEKHIEGSKVQFFSVVFGKRFLTLKKNVCLFLAALGLSCTRRIFDALYGLLSSGVWAPEWTRAQ